MKKSLAVLAVALLGVGCNPNIPQTPPPTKPVTALFDPAAAPPVVPSPNDLATDPTTGLLNIPLSPTASAADIEFAGYLDTLDGFPADSPAIAQFDGALKPGSVGATSVKIIDVTLSNAPVALTPSYSDISTGGQITISPPATGWTPGHTYAVALIGGTSGLQGSTGQPVVGSQTWFLVRSSNSLVTGCTDPTSLSCVSATSLIPPSTDGGLAPAAQLEQLRLHYKPLLDTVATGGVNRTDIVLAWTFKISDTVVSMQFQPAAVPPQVPIPNDLAINPDSGLVNAPVDPSTPPANQEFITDYVNNLNGFPVPSTGVAAAVGGALDPTTISNASVLVIDTTGSADGGSPAAVITYDSVNNAIDVSPPGGAWQKGHRYAVAVVGNAAGVRGTGNKPVIGSDVWALVRSKASLVTCTSPTDLSTCTSTLTLVPLPISQVLQLEQLRLGYSPILDGLDAQGIHRSDVALLWTFSIDGFPEATFDPANGIIPFPNNLLLADAGTPQQHVNLPIPPGAPPQIVALYGGLNTLDGFSTSAPAITSNSTTVPSIDIGQIDQATLAAPATGFIWLSAPTDGGGPPPPQVAACVNCASSPLADGGVQPFQSLQFVPKVPLAERSTYAPYVTTGAKNTAGQPITPSLTFALLRLKNPLVQVVGTSVKSTVVGVSDVQALQLEPLRQLFKPLIDGFVAQGIPRANLSLAWTFTTQTTASVLQVLHAYPTLASLPTTPLWAVDVTSSVVPALGPLPHSHIGKVFIGELVTAFLLTNPAGTFNPGLAGAVPEKIPFVLVEPFLPDGGIQQNSPVTLFGHGLTRSRTDMLLLADSLAAGGQASFATDVIWHGGRTICTGVGAILGGGATDDFACANPLTQKCDPSGLCVDRNPASRAACNPSTANADLVCTVTPPAAGGGGACIPTGATTGLCQHADFLAAKYTADGGIADATPAISGWNILNLTNFFATRDNFRQQVVDLSQDARVIMDNTTAGNLSQLASAQGGGTLDGTNINYAGQSLGGILGTLYNSAATETHQVVLNVPGADLPTILLTSPSFVSFKNAFEATLHAQGIDPGTPAFDQFIGIAKWVLDPADPGNAAFGLTHAPGIPADRHALIQYIQGDQTVPNPTTLELIAAANQIPNDTKAAKVYEFVGSGTVMLPDPANRHGFLLNWGDGFPQTTGQAQDQVVTFIASHGAILTSP